MGGYHQLSMHSPAGSNQFFSHPDANGNMWLSPFMPGQYMGENAPDPYCYSMYDQPLASLPIVHPESKIINGNADANTHHALSQHFAPQFFTSVRHAEAAFASSQKENVAPPNNAQSNGMGVFTGSLQHAKNNSTRRLLNCLQGRLKTAIFICLADRTSDLVIRSKKADPQLNL